MADVNRGDRPLSPHLQVYRPAADLHHLDLCTDYRRCPVGCRGLGRVVVFLQRPWGRNSMQWSTD